MVGRSSLLSPAMSTEARLSPARPCEKITRILPRELDATAFFGIIYENGRPETIPRTPRP